MSVIYQVFSVFQLHYVKFIENRDLKKTNLIRDRVKRLCILNTRKKGKTAKLPKVKLDFARRSFYFLGASFFNSLPLNLRNIDSRVLFRKALDDYYL